MEVRSSEMALELTKLRHAVGWAKPNLLLKYFADHGSGGERDEGEVVSATCLAGPMRLRHPTLG